jgi:hypothetical protein
VVPTGGDRVAVLVDVGPFDSPIVFMMASRFDEMSQQVFRARVELQHHDYFAATAQEDLLTVGVLLTPGTSSGRAWDTTMVAAKATRNSTPSTSRSSEPSSTTACGTPEDAPVADLIRVCEPARSAL